MCVRLSGTVVVILSNSSSIYIFIIYRIYIYLRDRLTDRHTEQLVSVFNHVKGYELCKLTRRKYNKDDIKAVGEKLLAEGPKCFLICVFCEKCK